MTRRVKVPKGCLGVFQASHQPAPNHKGCVHGATTSRWSSARLRRSPKKT